MQKDALRFEQWNVTQAINRVAASSSAQQNVVRVAVTLFVTIFSD
jgi:hypothetical protein